MRENRVLISLPVETVFAKLIVAYGMEVAVCSTIDQVPLCTSYAGGGIPQCCQDCLLEEDQVRLGGIVTCGANEEVRAAVQSVDRNRS